jgi:hypothetical protein
MRGRRLHCRGISPRMQTYLQVQGVDPRACGVDSSLPNVRSMCSVEVDPRACGVDR